MSLSSPTTALFGRAMGCRHGGGEDWEWRGWVKTNSNRDQRSDLAKSILQKAYCYGTLHASSTRSAPVPGKDIFRMIRHAIDTAPRNGYVAELHLQVLKYADDLEGTSGKDFCAALDLNKSWGTEFAKMKKISARLRAAGLNPAMI